MTRCCAVTRPLLAGALLLLAGCGGGGSSGPSAGQATAQTFDWDLPAGFPVPVTPAANPMSEAKVALGRRLFYDTRLSVNDSLSCAGCHQQRFGFADARALPVGATGDVHPRNSMGLANVVYNATQNWANPAITTLHDQALIPMFGEFPVELGWSGHEQEILDRLRRDPDYPALFADAYPEADQPITPLNVAKGVAAFVATLIAGNSAYDQAVFQGRPQALSAAATRGMDLFFSERLECFHCHGGFNLAQSVDFEGLAFDQSFFQNNGLYNVDGQGGYPADNRGLWEFTLEDRDMGRFRAPALRNIALTAPYMHDGSIATLEEVIAHYARGGRLIESGPHAGDGAASPVKSSLIAGFSISPDEIQDLLAFFEALTDWSFICDPALADPFGNIPPHPRCLE